MKTLILKQTQRRDYMLVSLGGDGAIGTFWEKQSPQQNSHLI